VNYYKTLIQNELLVISLLHYSQHNNVSMDSIDANIVNVKPTLLWVDDEPDNNMKVFIILYMKVFII
jgi:hypothetical protein